VPSFIGKNYGRIFLEATLVQDFVFRSNQWFQKCPRLWKLDSLSILLCVTIRENEQVSEGRRDESCRFDFQWKSFAYLSKRDRLNAVAGG